MLYKLPGYDAVIGMHDTVIEYFGGLNGLPHPEYVDAAIKRPETFMQYDDNCDLFLVCALILDSLTRYHAFADGNKRTALMALLFTYNINAPDSDLRYSLVMNEKFEELVLDVARNKPGIKDIRDRFQKLVEEFS
jgi:death-on-curing protein